LRPCGFAALREFLLSYHFVGPFLGLFTCKDVLCMGLFLKAAKQIVGDRLLRIAEQTKGDCFFNSCSWYIWGLLA